MDPILPPGARPALPASTKPAPLIAGGIPPPSALPPPPNPRLRLDPALGVVVMEFRNGSGQVQRSLPSEPELQAYRLAQRIGLKHAPSGAG